MMARSSLSVVSDIWPALVSWTAHDIWPASDPWVAPSSWPVLRLWVTLIVVTRSNEMGGISPFGSLILHVCELPRMARCLASVVCRKDGSLTYIGYLAVLGPLWRFG